MGTNYVPESISAGLDTTSTLNTNMDNIQTSLSRMLNTYNDNTVGSNELHSDLDFNSQRAINVADGVNNSDAVTYRQLIALVGASSSGGDAVSLIENRAGSDASVSNVFTLLGISYSPGSSNLSVYRNGARLQVGLDYTETTATTITLTFDPNDSDTFVFITNTYTSTTSDVTGIVNQGSGSPEGVLTASVGAMYLRSDGGASTTLCIKESGTGNTGWVGK